MLPTSNTLAFQLPGMTKSMRNNRDMATMSYDEHYNYYMFHLLSLALTRFTWNNLPKHIPADFLERTLIQQGQGALTYDKITGTQFFPCAGVGELDIYGIPRNLLLYPFNGNGSTIRRKTNIDVALIQNNFGFSSDMWIIQYYAKQLANIRNTQNINIAGQKTTQLIATDKKNEQTMKNAYQQQQLGSQVLFTTRDFNKESMDVYTVTAPVVFDKLQDQVDSLWNDALSMLGINTPSVNKKERVVVDEVNANNVEVQQNSVLRLNYRQQACDIFNEIYKDELGTDEKLSVELTAVNIESEQMELANSIQQNETSNDEEGD